MRKLSLLMLSLFMSGVLLAGEGIGLNSVVNQGEEGKFKTALKKVFNNQEEDAEAKLSVSDVDGETDEIEEEAKPFPLSLGLDLVSRYVWRGIDFGASPAVQPYVEYSIGKGNFTWGIGVWGSYAFTGPAASEFDIYSYIGVGPVTLTFTDYFFPGEAWGGDAYFTHGSDNGTGHVYELMLSAGGDFPLYGTAAINLGGADTQFSSYFELGATVYDGIDLFVGAAYDNMSGYYMARPKGKTYKFNVINVGMSASYDIEVKKVTIPISASVVFNPEARNAWFVVGIGLSN